MALFGKPTARQKEIRRSKAERQQVWYRRLGDKIRVLPLALLVLSALAAALIVTAGEDPLDLRVGQRIARPLTSRVAFWIEDRAATEEERRRARDNAPSYYTLDTTLLLDISNRLAKALTIAREQATDPAQIQQRAAEVKVLLDEEGLAELLRLAGLPKSTVFQRAVERAVRTLRGQPLVEAHQLARRRTATEALLVDVEQSIERPVPGAELLYANNAEHVERAVQAAAAAFPEPLRAAVKASLLAMLRETTDVPAEDAALFKPLYRYSLKLSTQAATEAESNVETQYNVYAAGTRLADAGEMSDDHGAISRDELKLLQDEHMHFVAHQRTDAAQRTARRLAGLARGLIAFLLVFVVGGYFTLLPEREPAHPRRWVASALTLLAMLALVRVIYLGSPPVHLAVGAQTLAVALLAITTTRAAAYSTGSLLALLITLTTRQELGFLVVLVVVSLAVFLGLREVRSRGRIIAVGGLAGLLAMVTTFLPGLIDGQDFGFIFWQHALWAGLATLAAAFLVEGLLPGIERLFDVTTSMTLLEWCDPNKPVLRMLAAEAPGTYNHSLLVGTLADAAAEAIGANRLLARTGAYYHDIGKINKPEYFVENQAMGVGNRHERLSPAMSHLIIIGHVKDGIEMAKEYGIPKSLHPFIPQHHGTSVVEYFYHAASQARRPGDPEVSDSQFRYPGPKPQARETAIAMLCDGVEGAVRAMTEPTPNRIEDTVDSVVQKRLMDGQLDECDLTFRELEEIRNRLVKSLSSIYHGRISYPTEENEAESRSAS